MAFWSWFWTINFIVAGSAFVGIALVVAFKGVADLRAMLAALRAEREHRVNFTALDWAIVGVYIALTLAAGLAGRKYVTNAGRLPAGGAAPREIHRDRNPGRH